MTRLYLMVAAVAAAVLYGSTYQQFRSFSLADPGGATDAVHYVNIARGTLLTDPELGHFRWFTPTLAHLALPIARQIVAGDDLSLRLAFYIVNFAFSLVACVALFHVLLAMHFSAPLSLLGVCAFASSRVTGLATATPLVDAAYFCAIAIVVWLAIEKWTIALALLLPVLVLTKETIIPFLLLPLLTDLRKSPAIWAGLAAAAITFIISGRIIEGVYAADEAPFVPILIERGAALGQTAVDVLTFTGIHDLQNGFSLWLPLAAIGAWLNAKHHDHDVPLIVAATVPIGIALALLSGNLGRMFFAAFPAVIAYALIAIEHVTNGRGGRPRAPYDA